MQTNQTKDEILASLEATIVRTYADIRSIERQIDNKKSSALAYGGEAPGDRQWIVRAESTLKRKLAQTRYLESDLSSIRRSGEDGASLAKYLHSNTLVKLAKAVEKYDIGWDEVGDAPDEEWLDIRNILSHIKSVAPILVEPARTN